MTAILAMNLGDRAVMLSDTAHIDGSGVVRSISSKIVSIPSASTVMAVQGPSFLCLFLRHLADRGRSFTSASDLWARLGAELRTFHAESRHLLNHATADRFSLVVACWRRCAGIGCWTRC